MQPWNLFLRVLFFLFFANSVTAQTVTSELVTPFLYKNDKEWNRSYEGRINGVHDVLLNLNSNGQDYWGTLLYLKSKVVLNVEGKVQGTKLLLNEFDLYGEQTGKYAGVISPEAITADWSNADNSIGARITLSSISERQNGYSSLWADQWVGAYEGNHKGRAVQLILQNDLFKPLHATFYFQAEHKTYTGEGVIHNNGNEFQINLQDENHDGIGFVRVKIENFNTLSCIFRTNDGYNKFFSLEKSFSLDPGLFEYASYASSYHASFPLINGQDRFNGMIMDIVNRWSENAQDHYGRIVWDLSFPKPEHRNAYRGYIWFNVDYLSEELISGSLTYSNTWDRDYKVLSFNYHFGDQKSLKLNELLDENADYKEFIQNQILKELAKRPFNEDQHYFNWVKRQDFNLFNIRNEGLVFRTNYSPIYGTQEVTIPYFRLRQFFNKGNPIEFLTK